MFVTLTLSANLRTEPLLISGAFLLVNTTNKLCFYWLRAIPRCVPFGQYLKASALIAESFDLVHEALLILVALS